MGRRPGATTRKPGDLPSRSLVRRPGPAEQNRTSPLQRRGGASRSLPARPPRWFARTPGFGPRHNGGRGMRSTFATALLISFALVPTSAGAKDDDPIVVTATRTPAEAHTLPAEVDVIDTEDARSRGV